MIYLETLKEFFYQEFTFSFFELVVYSLFIYLFLRFSLFVFDELLDKIFSKRANKSDKSDLENKTNERGTKK